MILAFGIHKFIWKIIILIVTGVYQIVNYSYQVFLVLAETNIFSQEQYQQLTNKVYIILGVAMLFVLAYNILMFIVDPDKNKGGSEVWKLVRNIVTSFILIVICPTLFSWAFMVQDAILNQGVIQNFFGASEDYGYDGESSIKQGGAIMAVHTFSAFFYPASGSTSTKWEGDATIEAGDSCESGWETMSKIVQVNNKWVREFPQLSFLLNGSDIDGTIERVKKLIPSDRAAEYEKEIREAATQTGLKEDCTLKDVKDYAVQTGSFSYFKNFAENVRDDEINFSWLVALIAGGYLVYVIISFCFDMAVRIVKLAFYQIIAPICITCRCLPNSENIFKNWWKAVSKTFLSVFIRIFIMNMGIYLITIFVSSDFIGTACANDKCSGVVAVTSYAFIILGIVTFIKMAPQLIDEVFGFESTPLGIKDKLKQGGAFAAGALIGSGVTSMARNAAHGIQNARADVQQAEGKWNKFKAVAKGVGRTAGSVAAGGATGAYRGGKAGWQAANASDMAKAAKSGAKETVEKREKRENYRRAKGGTFQAMVGRVKDAGRGVKNYVLDQSEEGLQRQSHNMGELASQYDNFRGGIETNLEKELAKGGGAAYLGNGFEKAKVTVKDGQGKDVNTTVAALFSALADKNRALQEVQAAFTRGDSREVRIEYTEEEKAAARTAYIEAVEGFSNGAVKSNGSHYTQFDIDEAGAVLDRINSGAAKEIKIVQYTAADVEAAKKEYIDARDMTADAVMNISAEGSKGASYQGLNEKGKSAIAESIVNAETLQATVIKNASSEVVQEVIGSDNLKKLANGGHLTADDYIGKDSAGKKIKLKDAANVAKGQADVQIAQMRKENAAKGDDK